MHLCLSVCIRGCVCLSVYVVSILSNRNTLRGSLLQIYAQLCCSNPYVHTCFYGALLYACIGVFRLCLCLLAGLASDVLDSRYSTAAA